MLSEFEYTKEHYQQAIAKRLKRLDELDKNPHLIKYELDFCREDFHHWANTWVWTFNPQNVGTDIPAWLPFEFFPKQVELTDFLDARLANQEDGLIVKGRELGYSWVTVTWATHKWRFMDGFVSTFTANLSDNVDKIGDPKSLFEKARLLLKFLPEWQLPFGFKVDQHATFMRILNPENNNVMTGAAGAEAGRGGRSTIVFIDEAAFVEEAERVDAATSANAKTRIWGSTVNGMGNLFARKRFSGQLRPDQIFQLHWKDDPRKNEEWAARERKRLEPHIYASEHELDFSASVEGICIPTKWVKAAQELKKYIKPKPSPEGVTGGDVGGGKAKSTAISRFGSIVLPPKGWRDPDTIETAYRMLDYVQEVTITENDLVYRSGTLYFDVVAIGRGVLDTLTRADRDNVITVPINTGVPASDMVWSDGLTSREKFANLKTELWCICKERLKNAYELLLFLKGLPEGIHHDESEILILPDDNESPECLQLITELSLPKLGRNEQGKQVMERKVAMAKRGIPSTDYADALMLTFCGNGAIEDWAKLGSN